MERRRIQFRGRVQGVGFRATTRSLASGHTVTGWVRNEPDGSVTAEIQGPAPEIDGLLSDLRDRMGRHIHAQLAESLPLRTGETGFKILR